MARHHAVAVCAVISVPEAQWGERVHAVVVLKQRQEATAEDIRVHCKMLIGGYKCPPQCGVRRGTADARGREGPQAHAPRGVLGGAGAARGVN